MATKVFTGSGVAFFSADAVDGAWTAAALAWTATNNINGDSGTITNTVGGVGGLRLLATLVDDASIPAAVRITSVEVEFDWHVVNAGGSSVGGPNANSLLLTQSLAASTVSQFPNTDTTGHFDFVFINPRTQLYGGLSATRADLFSHQIGWEFDSPQRNGVSTSQIAVTNYTVTVTYVNIGTGSWLIHTSALTTPTGSVDLATFGPDIAQITTGSASGTISAPIADTAGAYLYIDGSATPVAIGGVPAGFTPDGVFFVSIQAGVQISGDSVTTVLAPLINIVTNFTNAGQVDFPLSGMTLAEMTALLGETLVSTLATGADPTVAALRLFVESDSSSGWDPYFSIGLWGSYTTATSAATLPAIGPMPLRTPIRQGGGKQ